MAKAKSKEVEMIVGTDISKAGIKADSEAIAEALRRAENRPKANIDALIQAGEAFELDGDAKYVVQGFDDATLINELNIRTKGMRKMISDISMRIERGIR